MSCGSVLTSPSFRQDSWLNDRDSVHLLAISVTHDGSKLSEAGEGQTCEPHGLHVSAIANLHSSQDWNHSS